MPNFFFCNVTKYVRTKWYHMHSKWLNGPSRLIKKINKKFGFIQLLLKISHKAIALTSSTTRLSNYFFG